MSLERVRVKFCGMRTRKDINHAIALGVHALGFIFYPKSTRAVTVAEAKILLAAIPPFVSTVAVLVNPTLEEVKEILRLPISYLQFHGDESPDFCAQFKKPYIKAIAASSAAAIINATERYIDAVALLVDTPAATYGGTGFAFDWQIIPKECAKPLILAGGLDANNVAEAIAQVNPFAVDVCSGVEHKPGVKDLKKMTDFIKQVHR